MTSQESSKERRHYQRIPFIAEVLMEQDGQYWSCSLLDLSLKGLLVEPPAELSPDKEKTYMVELVLGEDAAIKMQAKVSHAEDSHWGLEWENIDIDGLTHLRRLLELNMENPEEMHRELAELG